MGASLARLEEQMRQALARGKEWMRSVRIEQAVDGKAVCGWGETERSTSIDPWGGTADGVLCLLKGELTGEDLELVEKAIRWLLENQNDDGGWGLWRGEEHGSRVYPTAVAVRALLRALRFLRRIGHKGLPVKEIRKRVEDGIRWLLNARGDRGVWGFVPRAHEVYPAHTAHAFITLYEWYELTGELSSRNFKLVMEDVRSFLLESMADGRKWASYVELVSDIKDPIAGGGREIGTTHFSTPWCIMALCLCGLSALDPPIRNAIEFLLSLQDEETGAFFFSQDARRTGDRRIWATHDAATALEFLISRLNDPRSLLREIDALAKRIEDLEEHFELCSAFVRNVENVVKDYGKDVFWLTCALILTPLALVLLYVWLAPLAFWMPIFLALIALLPYYKVIEALVPLLRKGPESLAKIRERAQELSEERRKLLRARRPSAARR